jgi:hypothetical protein
VRNKGKWLPASQLELGNILIGHDGLSVKAEEAYDTRDYDTVCRIVSQRQIAPKATDKKSNANSMV